MAKVQIVSNDYSLNSKYTVSILDEETNYVHLRPNGWVFHFGNL